MPAPTGPSHAPRDLHLERLEARDVPATAALVGSVLSVVGDPGADRIEVYRDGGQVVVRDGTVELGRFDSATVTAIGIDALDGNNKVVVDAAVDQPATIAGGAGRNVFDGGSTATTFLGGPGRDIFFGSPLANSYNGDGGVNDLYKVLPTDVVFPNPGDRVLREIFAAPVVPQVLTTSDVDLLLKRAAAASASSDAIIVVTDRSGSILGVRVEGGVDPAITGNLDKLVFAIDGAYSLALTGAYFGNNQAPLTSRTIQKISQSTITQREVEADPSIADPNSTDRGPGFVAAVGIKAHFPPGVPFTPQVDLFQIEHTNRDSTIFSGADRITGTADDTVRPQRFNIDPAFVPAGQTLTVPDSYGFQSGRKPTAKSRGIGTLPGGIPIFKNGQEVGGIGVFFPGKTGFATEANSSLSETFDPTKPDRSLEAEWIAFAAVGGIRSSIGGAAVAPVDALSGVPVPTGFGLPNGRIDLVGITLDIFGQGGAQGVESVLAVGNRVGRGSPDDGANQVVTQDGNADGVANDPAALRTGRIAPEGWLVTPHDGVGVSAEDVRQIIAQGLAQANLTRAAIRLPLSSRTRMVFAVADRNGTVVGLYRMPDATVFSIDVAVAKARNVNYYADAAKLQPVDRVAGVPAGAALTNRTFRYLGEPRFPEGIDGAPPGPFSQLLDGGADLGTGLQVGPRKAASAYQSVVGYDAFNPGTNFRDPTNPLNQNGIVFFPGSAPLYRNGVLVGGFGVSGDGVDQDDVVTAGGQVGFEVPGTVLRADQTFTRGVRLPYQKGNRNPEG